MDAKELLEKQQRQQMVASSVKVGIIVKAQIRGIHAGSHADVMCFMVDLSQWFQKSFT